MYKEANFHYPKLNGLKEHKLAIVERIKLTGDVQLVN